MNKDIIKPDIAKPSAGPALIANLSYIAVYLAINDFWHVSKNQIYYLKWQ